MKTKLILTATTTVSSLLVLEDRLQRLMRDVQKSAHEERALDILHEHFTTLAKQKTAQ